MSHSYLSSPLLSYDPIFNVWESAKIDIKGEWKWNDIFQIIISHNEWKNYPLGVSKFILQHHLFWAELTIGKLKRQFGLFQAFNSQCGLITLT